MTVTSGSRKYTASASSRSLGSSVGVFPAAVMSSISGAQMNPSGQTGPTMLIPG